MKKYLKIIFTAAFVFFAAAPITAITLPQQASAGPACEKALIGIPPWYRGLTENDCSITIPTGQDEITAFIWRVALNVAQIFLILIAYIAIGFILFGGFLYITGGGNAGQIEKARKSIFNAVIGLAISLSAVAVTNFIFGIIGSSPAVDNGIPQLSGEQILAQGLNMVYFIAGTLAVVMIVIGGLMYVSSSGDSGRITKAKNTLTYAIVGLIIVLVAFAITNFVIGRFS